MKTPKTLPGVSHTCRLLYVKHTLVFGLYSGGFLQPYQRYFNQAQLRLAATGVFTNNLLTVSTEL